jgi:filamentous hemagglutinin family protein
MNAIVNRRHLTLTPIAIAVALAFPWAAVAAPTGGNVVSGSAGIVSGADTVINQSSQKAIINWQGFSVGASESVTFNQPSASSVTLNRVIGNERSLIDGKLTANGQVFLVNPQGVLFGAGAVVDVGGIVASTRDITNANFNSGNYVFSGDGAGEIRNVGTIIAGDGGYVAFLGQAVANDGYIAAHKGSVALGAGQGFTLTFAGSALTLTIDEGDYHALAANSGIIEADGGRILLTARAAEALGNILINNTGTLQARSIADLTGNIEVYAHGGTANIDGTLDASAPVSGNGGFIETSGDKVKIADGTIITTLAANGKSGTWLIDPTNFTISAGSAASATSGIGAQTLSTNLGSTNVEIQTSSGGSEAGDIYVNGAVSWDANTTLTLNAVNDININKAITATGASAGLTFNAGNDININNAVTLEGASATLNMNYGGYTSANPAKAGSNYNILTPASFSGADVVDPVEGVAGAGESTKRVDTSGGVYGSITFSNENTDGLTINGQGYELIHSLDNIADTGTATSKEPLNNNLNIY